MRISDWSSDVCSSDLSADPAVAKQRIVWKKIGVDDPRWKRMRPFPLQRAQLRVQQRRQVRCDLRQPVAALRRKLSPGGERQAILPVQREIRHCLMKAGRSEEHTSELQSLMRTSYAVFCLKKK